MTTPFLTLAGVSFVLPDGRRLFSDIDLHLDDRPTGLVGRNGAGKSVLAKILAGELAPTTGRRICGGRVHHLRQQVDAGAGTTVAGLAGVREVLDALARIEAGSVATADFERVDDRWDIRQRLALELDRQGLGGLDPGHPAACLSGGEAMRVALAGAWLSDADLLVLDEPSNHLDSVQRERLRAQLGAWSKGLLVVSHDRALLDSMQRIVELSDGGLRDYAGPYASYVRQRAEEEARALDALDAARLDARRQRQALREQRERLDRRQSRGRRAARDANQAPILLGGQKARSEVSAGRARGRLEAARVAADARVRQAAGGVERSPAPAMFAPDAAATDRVVVRLERAVLPHVPGTVRGIDLLLRGRQRIAVSGANGSGKSTLLKVLAGELPPASGRCDVRVPAVRLDQRLGVLDPAASVWTQLRAANPLADDAGLRTRLALIGFDASQVTVPTGLLSGGERLKAALACALYAATPAQLLLLDEPGNHLDLAALEALEQTLRQYRGALVVVSHDAAFLEEVQPTHRIEAGDWRLRPW